MPNTQLKTCATLGDFIKLLPVYDGCDEMDDFTYFDYRNCQIIVNDTEVLQLEYASKRGFYILGWSDSDWRMKMQDFLNSRGEAAYDKYLEDEEDDEGVEVTFEEFLSALPGKGSNAYLVYDRAEGAIKANNLLIATERYLRKGDWLEELSINLAKVAHTGKHSDFVDELMDKLKAGL